MKKTKERVLISQLFWQLLPSQIFCSMVATLSTLINGLIVGNSLNSDSVAALGLVGVLSAAVGTISSLISGGARIVCGKYIGRGEFKKVDSAFTASLITLTLVGGVLTVTYLLFSNGISVMLGATGSIIETTASYIKANSLGLLPLLISPCLMTFLDMNNQTRYSLMCASILALCNLVFGLININIVHGGLFGIGIAASLSQIVCLICLVIRFVKDKSLTRIDTKSLTFKTYTEIIVLGLPSALGVLYQVRNVILNRYAGIIGGADAVTALSILNTCAGVFDSIAIGTGSTVIMIASVLYGEQDRHSLIEFMKFGILMTLIIFGAKGAVFTLLREPIAIIFGASGNILTLAKELLFYYGITMLFNAFPCFMLNYYAATGNSKITNAFYPFTCLIFPLGSMILLKPSIGITAVWSSYLFAEFLMTIAIFLVSTIKNKHIPKSFEDVSLIDKSVGVDKDDSISITVNTVDEVVEVSKKVSDFAKDKGADNRKSYMLGLCLEEMASNIVLHGFTKGKKNKDYYVDIYVSYKDGLFNTRLRDNAPNFNPQRRLEQDKDDPTKNIGIKMVNKIADEMNYQTTFGMNVLTIKM